MMKYFEYKKSNDQDFNDLVDCSLDLARASYEGKKGADYTEKNAELLRGIGKKMVEGTRYEARFAEEGLSIFKSPNVKNNTTVRDNFNAILAEVTTAIVPEVVNDQFSRFVAEIHQVGYGDTARFTIESNDLFKVNSKAEGVRKGVDQPMFDTEITVAAHPVTIDAAIDWYPFAAGIFDMGNFGVKIARSFSAYIFTKIVKGMMLYKDRPEAAGYKINGFHPMEWANLKDKVSAANGGMNVIAVGTTAALTNVSLGGNFQVAIGEEMNKVGYLDQYLNTPLIALNNVLVPGTVNGANPALALSDDVIFMIPVGGSKPIKIVFEGDEISVSCDPESTSDKRYGISVEMRIGSEIIVGHKYGFIIR